jgi:3-oxoacyl-[acyl-carrier protein] reductase
VDDTILKALSPEDREELIRKSKAAAGDAETTAKTIKDMGGEAVPFFGDVSNFEVARNLIQTAVDSFGKIDILVNVVGTFAFANIWEMSEETWDHVNGNKPKSHFNCIRHALPFMMEQKWGRIINCTSGGFAGGGNQSNYAAANAGVLGLTYGVAKEVYKFGITCNAFGPAANTRASFELKAYLKANPEVESNLDPGAKMAVSMLDTMPGPEYVPPFILYLSTDAAAKISGSVFLLIGPTVGIYSDMEIKKSIIAKDGGKWTVEELAKEVPQKLLDGYHSIAAPPEESQP